MGIQWPPQPVAMGQSEGQRSSKCRMLKSAGCYSTAQSSYKMLLVFPFNLQVQQL
jgi:hypothetical protein